MALSPASHPSSRRNHLAAPTQFHFESPLTCLSADNDWQAPEGVSCQLYRSPEMLPDPFSFPSGLAKKVQMKISCPPRLPAGLAARLPACPGIHLNGDNDLVYERAIRPGIMPEAAAAAAAGVVEGEHVTFHQLFFALYTIDSQTNDLTSKFGDGSACIWHCQCWALRQYDCGWWPLCQVDRWMLQLLVALGAR